VFIVVPFRKAW